MFESSKLRRDGDQTLFAIHNDPADRRLVASTNYWSTDNARQGLVYLSGNAGTWRLLCPVPSILSDALRGVRGTAITQGSLGGRQSIEILLDDGSPTPFAIHISSEQADRTVSASAGIGRLLVYVQDGGDRVELVSDYPCHTRLSATLPDMRPWDDPVVVPLALTESNDGVRPHVVTDTRSDEWGRVVPCPAYPRELPAELAAKLCYLSDSGWCVRAIAAAHLEGARASGQYADNEGKIPVRSIERYGWFQIEGGWLVSPYPYDKHFGPMVPEEDEERHLPTERALGRG